MLCRLLLLMVAVARIEIPLGDLTACEFFSGHGMLNAAFAAQGHHVASFEVERDEAGVYI